MKYFKAVSDIVVNTVDGHYIIPKDSYALQEADGRLTACSEAELDANVTRIEADIVARDAEIARLAEEARVAEEARLAEEARIAAEQAEINKAAEEIILEELGV